MARNAAKQLNKGKGNSKPTSSRPTNNRDNSGRRVKPGCDKSGDIKMNTPKPESGDVNDSSYYYYNEEMKRQICNFSFNEYLGRPIPFDESPYLGVSNQSYPGNVMAILVNPSVAPTGDPNLGRTNGVNLAGLKNFTDITKKNGRRGNYGPEHMTILLLYLAEVIKMVTFCSRPFGILNWFDVRNRAIPRMYFDAMDIDYDDFVMNAADYRIKLNTIIANIDKIPIPMNVPILAKAADWFKSIYVDKDNPMHQSYLFCPYSTWVLDESAIPSGSLLETTYLRTNPEDPDQDFTFKRYLDVLDLMVQRLLASSTMQEIFSDMMLCASNGELNLGSLTMVPSDYQIDAIMSSEIRSWVHNMVIIGPPVDQDWKHELYPSGNTGANDVWGSAEHTGVIYNPEFWGCGVGGNWKDQFIAAPVTQVENVGCAAYNNLIVDFDHDPTDEEKIETLRLATRGIYYHDDREGYKCMYTHDIALGDAYVVEVLLFDADTVTPSCIPTTASTSSALANVISALSDLTDFNDYPMTYLYTGVNTITDTKVTFTRFEEVGELNFFTMTDYDFMKRMYDAEMIGLFTFR